MPGSFGKNVQKVKNSNANSDKRGIEKFREADNKVREMVKVSITIKEYRRLLKIAGETKNWKN